MQVITIFLAVIASSAATTLNCHFTRNVVFGYVCEIRNVELIEGSDVTIGHADHEEGKTDADVKMVSFIKSSVGFLPNQVFTIFPNVEILDLLEVNLLKWNRDFLKNAKNLKRIWLAKNEIEELGDNSFMGASALENLILRDNKITKISEKAFNGLVQLKSLELQNNLMTSLNMNVFSSLKKLKELNLSYNMITKVDENAFAGSNKIEFLNLDHNNITELPANVFKGQTNLTVVYMQNNQIEKVSPELFTDCSNLMELRMDNNQLMEIPFGLFGSNKKFKLLNIMNNPLEAFDGKVLPEEMELLYLDESVITQNMPEKLEIFRAEKSGSTLWTNTEAASEFTTANQ